MTSNAPTVDSVEIKLKENIFGFQGNQRSPYLKIIATDPRWIPGLRNLVEQGNANYRGLWKGAEGVQTFDNLQYVLRFMVDTGVSNMVA